MKIRRTWARIEPHVATRRAALVLFALAFGVYWLQALGWPFQRGRDAWDYFIYYLSYLDGDTPFPLVMLVRTPVTPLVLGVPMHVGGAFTLEVLLALLFAAAVVAWAAAAATFARLAGLLVGVALLVHPAFASVFHETSSDPVSAAGFAFWSLGLVRTCFRPTTLRFAGLGAGVAALALTRPANVVLLAACLLPLVTPGGWRVRAKRGACLLAAGALPVALWAVHNDVRYGDLTLSRLRVLTAPFPREFQAGDMDPGNGPASRSLARLVEQRVLTLPRYRRLGVDATTYFHSSQTPEALRLAGLVDRIDGIGADYARLHAAAREAPPSQRGFWIGDVDVGETLRAMKRFVSSAPPREDRSKPDQAETPPRTINVDGRPFPNPAAFPPAAEAASFGTLGCPSNDIRRCTLSNPSLAYEDPAQARRYAEIVSTVTRWDAPLGTRSPNEWMERQLFRANVKWPRPWFWLLLAAVGLAVRRPRGTWVILAVVALSGVVLAEHAALLGAEMLFALPFYPVPVFAAVCALVGERRTPVETQSAA